jgi:nicotinate-nucleotide pyrophosphorylase (carboxylating)
VRRVRATGTPLEIEVEVRSLDELREALDARVTRILLDNMSPDMLRQAVALAGGRARLEASGGVTLDNVRAIAEAGVDDISIGALTHSAHVFDVSLEWVAPRATRADGHASQEVRGG